MTQSYSFALTKAPEQQSLSIEAIAKMVSGTVKGDASVMVSGVATIQNATPQSIAFLAERNYVRYLKDTKAGAVIVGERDVTECATPLIVVENPKAAFAQLIRLFNPLQAVASEVHPSAVIHPTAVVAKSAMIGPNVTVGANAVIGEQVQLHANVVIGDEVSIGDNTVCHPGVVIYYRCQIGANCTFQANAVIGSEGFGFAMNQGQWLKFQQVGAVKIGDNVEIGACTTVDRGAIEDTIIDDGCIIDNGVQVAHNARIGAHTAIASGAAIAGSTQLGKYCMVGGHTCFNGHITICDGVQFVAGSMVSKSIDKPDAFATAIPAQPIREWKRNIVRYNQLDDMNRRIKELEQSLSALKSGQEETP